MKQVFKSILIGISISAASLGIYHYYYGHQTQTVIVEKPITRVDAYQTSYLPPSQQLSMDFNASAESALHSVVHIQTEFTRKSNVYDQYFSLEDFFYNGRSRVYKASGSGVIISSDGYIVTNNHVVQQADKITIILNDKRSYDGKIIGLDPSTDLALIKIDDNDLPYLTFGNSDSLKIGEWVLAVGNPFNLTSTVTAGIVSAKARNINILGGNTAIESFIQTDAAVNPGNSGGALVNIAGDLVGINAAIASRTGYYQGYSFAIPASLVKKVVKDLKEYGKVQRAVIGVSIAELNADLAKSKGLKQIKGVFVEGVVKGLPADKAGLKEGDVILEIDQIKINSPSELLERIGMHRPGEKIEVLYLRNNKEDIIKLTLTDMGGQTDLKSADEEITFELGASFEKISSQVMKDLKISNGVQVKNLTQGQLARAGIKENFIITRIDQKPVNSIEDINKILKDKKGGVLIEGIYPSGVKAYYGLGL